jgi:hypothetical protein
MASLRVEHVIPAPQEKVFALSSDFPYAADRIEAITRIEILTNPHPDDAVGLGTRFRETRILFGREATEEMEVTLFEPPHRYVLEADSHGAHYVTEVRFKAEGPAGEATRVTFDFQAYPQTVFARIMSFLTAPLMRKALRQCLVKDLEDLERAAVAAR